MAEAPIIDSPAVTTRGDLAARIVTATGNRPTAMVSLGLSRHPIYRAELEDGRMVIAKLARPGLGAEPEAHMLRYLAQHSSLPMPQVLFSDNSLIVMEFIDAERGLTMTNAAQENAAEHLVALHGVTAKRFGHERETVLGPLPQPKPWTTSGREFFRGVRLLYMAQVAVDAGRLPHMQMQRLERLAARLVPVARRSARRQHPGPRDRHCGLPRSRDLSW